MGEPLPEDPVLLRSLFSEAAKFLDGVEPFLALAKFHRAEIDAILAAGHSTPRRDAYLIELETNMLKARAAWAPFPDSLFRYMTEEELDWLESTREATDRRAQARAKLPAALVDKLFRQDQQEMFPAPLASVTRRLHQDIFAKLEVLSRAEEAPATPQCPVVLGARDECPTIRGVKVPPLTVSRHRVIKAVLDVWPNGLSRDDLMGVTGDAVNTFKRLRKIPPWETVLILPGKDGRGLGYRIAKE